MPSIEESIRKEIKLLTKGDGNVNYCVKAGAGAGKTTILSERISRQLIEGAGIPIEEFVVITYTNTAASELHARIAEELSKIVSKGSEPECTKAKEALSRLDLMQISTIHSFLFNILREFSFDAGVAMDVQMLDEDEDNERIKAFFDNWYSEHGDEIIANGLTYDNSTRKSNDWIFKDSNGHSIDKTRDIYQDTFITLANNRDEISCDKPQSPEAIANELSSSAKEVLKVLIKLKDDSTAPAFCSLTDNGKTTITKTKLLFPLIGKDLNADDVASIIDAYKKFNTKLFNEIKNESIPDYPEFKKEKRDTIKNALDNRDKKGDDPILALKDDAIEILTDLVYVCEHFEEEEKRPLSPNSKFSINKKGLKLNADVIKNEHLITKPLLDIVDIYTILALFEQFKKVGNFLYNTKNEEIEEFDYPDSDNNDYIKINNYLICQKSLRVIEYVLKMQQAYQDKIDNEALYLSNDDILYRAQVLLKKHPDVLEELRRRYTKIYIDEFQDTTPIQTKIMKMLSSKPGTPTNDFKPDENKLFVVGDPKQSIYRFTGADKSIFEKLYDDFLTVPEITAVSKAVELNDNYRSNSDIVDWVNKTFCQPDFVSNMNTDWVVTEKDTLHGVFQYSLSDDERDIYCQESDVNAVVNLVEDLVGKPYCMLKEGKDKDVRKIRYSDITIIFKKTTHMEPYLKAFSENLIPVRMQGKYSVSEDETLKNFIILLDFFANSKNKAKKVAAAQVLCANDAVKYDIESLENKLYDLRNNVFRKCGMDTASIVQYLFSHDDLYLPAHEYYLDISEISQNRIRLHQMIETCLADNDGNLRTLVDSMYQYIEKRVNHELELERNNDAVKFINVHKVKGMSEQIVIIADRNNEEKDDDVLSGFRASDNKYYPSASYEENDYGKRKYFPSFLMNTSIMEEAKRKTAEDLMCLQYVAATRAKNALIIMPQIKGNVWFSSPIFDYENLDCIRKWIKKQQTSATGTEDVKEDKTRENTIVLDNLADELAKDSSALADKSIVSITPSGLELEMQTGYTTKETGYTEEIRPSNNVFGTVMHRVYELLIGRRDVINDTNKEEQVKRAINQAILESYADIVTDSGDRRKNYFDYLHETLINRGYLDKLLSLVKDAEEVYTEFDFSFFVPDKKEFKSRFQLHLDNKEIAMPDRSEIWVNGKADLVVKTKAGLIVYDYKSDKTNGKPLNEFEEAMAKKYAGQLELYKYALGKSFGIDPDSVKTELIHLYLS